MDLLKTVRSYVINMLKVPGENVMKVLLMDAETIGMISIAFLQSELVKKQVFLFESMDNQSAEKLPYLSCVCFLRPTETNVIRLCAELLNPRYGSYYLFFSNVTDRSLIRQIAEADRYEVVNELQEFYIDYYAFDRDLFSVETSPCSQGYFDWDTDLLTRCVQSLMSVMLSTKTYPIIRYQQSSNMCKELAEKLSAKMSREASLFNFKSLETSVLLIVDRREDPVTPILNQWTYQAMLHEIIGLNRNRIDTGDFLTLNRPSDEPTEIILNVDEDEFYAVNRYKNFGEIGVNIKNLLETYQERHKTQSKLETIADMKKFIETYPDFKKLSNTVTKHIKLISELSMQVSTFRLMDVSEIEQKIVCSVEHDQTFRSMKALITAEDLIRDSDSVRLAALYFLRYEDERKGEIAVLKKLLEKKKLNTKWRKFLDLIYKYGGRGFRQADIFNNHSSFSFSRQLIKGLMGVENVYGQHRPLLTDLIDQLLRSRLKESVYPYMQPHSTTMATNRINDFIVFSVGGITYEEANFARILMHQHRNIKTLSELHTQPNLIIGGTSVHNFRSFVDEVISGASVQPIVK
ncbi:hypothetical protein ACOME3_004708 [Neoechinorhynchus agilis]